MQSMRHSDRCGPRRQGVHGGGPRRRRRQPPVLARAGGPVHEGRTSTPIRKARPIVSSTRTEWTAVPAMRAAGRLFKRLRSPRVSASDDPNPPLAKFCRCLNRCLLRDTPPLRRARGADRVASPDANFFGTSIYIRSEPLGHQIRKVASEYSLNRQRNSTGWSRRSRTPFLEA